MNDLVEDLQQAWDFHEKQEEGEAEGGAELTVVQDEPKAEAETASVESEASEPAAEGGETPAEDTPDEVEPAAEAKPAEDEQKPTEAGEDEIKAPVGFSPEAREDWGKVPATVKRQIQERERQIAEAMHGTSEARKTHETMENMVGRYYQVLAAEGAETPLDALSNIVQTVAMLRMGSPQQKAATLASLVGHYGVDINALDSALAGEGFSAEEGASQTPDVEALINEKLQPFNEVFNNLAGQYQQTEQQRAAQTQSELQQFANSHEFFADVREDMADLFELASKRNTQLSLEDAYNRACAMHPEINKVLEKRKQEQALLDTNSAADRKLEAASSVTGSQQAPAAASGAPATTSLREDLEAVWGQYS